MSFNFTRGQFHWFRATTKFHVGALSCDLMEGQEVEFDGTVLRMDGDSHTAPQLRGAVERGWLTLSSSPERVSSGYVPTPSGVKVSPALGSDPRTKPVRNQTMTVSVEESEVSSLSAFKSRFSSDETASGETEGVKGVQATTTRVESNVGIDSVPVTIGSTQGNVGVDGISTNVGSVRRASLSVESERQDVVVPTKFSTPVMTAPHAMRDSATQYEAPSMNREVLTIGEKPQEVSTFPWTKGVFSEFTVTQRFGSGVIDGHFEEGDVLEFDGWTLRYDGSEYSSQGVQSLRKALDNGLLTLVSSADSEEELIGSEENPSDSDFSLPNGEIWDMSPHWRTRAKIALEKYSDEPDVLDAICGLETKGVVAMIRAQ